MDKNMDRKEKIALEKGVFGVICGAIGAVIGSVATYFFTKNKIENSVREECEGRFRQAQNDLNEYYKANFEPKREPVKDSILMQARANTAAKMAFEERKTEDGLRVKDDVIPPEYNNFYDASEDDKLPSDGSEYEFYEEYGGIPDGKYPRIIPRKDYENPNGYNKLKLIYYEESGIFAHVGDSSDSGFGVEYFGLQNCGEFGNYKYDDGETDPYTLFFRDDDIETDFEVYYEPNETYDEVLEREGRLVDD